MTIDQVKQLNADVGQHYFKPATMRFFNSRVMSDVFVGTRYGVAGVYFCTSERCDWGDGCPRLFSVRWIATEDGEFPSQWRTGLMRSVETGHVYSASEFQEFKSRSGALAAAERFARTGGAEIPVEVQ